MSDPVRAAYAAGLAMLSRRELSEAQIRERLRRKGHDDDMRSTRPSSGCARPARATITGSR